MDTLIAPAPILASRAAPLAGQGARRLPDAFSPLRPGEEPAASLPVAVVAVPVPTGEMRNLRGHLLSLARSRCAGNLPVAPGALAVLILAEEVGALAIAEGLAPHYPFPLRVETGPGDPAAVVRRAAAWAGELDRTGAPVLISEIRQPVAPRWAYAALSALRDGADLLTRRTGLWKRLTAGPFPPFAFSGRAQRAMESWHATSGKGSGKGRPATWAGRSSPWRRPVEAGLHAITG